MGQTRPVTSIRLIVEDSVEIHIQKMQERKAQLAEMGLNKMSRAEIMAQRVCLFLLTLQEPAASDLHDVQTVSRI
jgi:hypothetical protein